jgi:hypothetical protein
MAGVVRRKTGAQVLECVDANLAGGTVVIPSTTATTQPGTQGMKAATDAAQNVLGVCINDCVTAANQAALQYPTGPAPMSAVSIDLTIPDVTSTVEDNGEFDVQYTAAAVAYGAKLCAAAGGKVRAWVSGTDSPAAIIGHCTQVGGVSSAGGTGRAFIRVQ